MTTEALDIYKTHLDTQLGENSPITQEGKYDPSGANESLYGVFENYSLRENKDSANVKQKVKRALFVVSEAPVFDIDLQKELYLPYQNKTFTIDYAEKDETGAQVLWLY